MSFSNIIGQDKAIAILRQYLECGHLKGGYLFSGPEGTGKKQVARVLTKAANCLTSTLDSCDECPSCRKIETGQHPDVHIVENGENQIKIEEIRQLQKDIRLRPYEARIKAFVIDNAHNLSAEASACLLKILEEPPGDSVIVLISDKPALLFKTILSRCKTIRFLPLPRAQLTEILKKDYGLDNNSAHFLAYYSEGRLGCSLRLKDTDMLATRNAVIDRFVFSKDSSLQGLPISDREDVRRILNILAAWFRDVYLIKIGMPHQELINFDRRKDLLKVMSGFSFSALNQILNFLCRSSLYLEQNINVKLLLGNLGAELWKM